MRLTGLGISTSTSTSLAAAAAAALTAWPVVTGTAGSSSFLPPLIYSIKHKYEYLYVYNNEEVRQCDNKMVLCCLVLFHTDYV